MLLNPHDLENGVQPCGKAAAGLQVPVAFRNGLKEAGGLRFGTAVRPDGAVFCQQAAVFAERDGAQAVAGTGDTAADGNSYVADAQCLCICIEYTTNNGYVTNTDRPWTVPMCTFFIAPDEATLDQYKDDANMILDNLMQNDEFTYMKQAYGRDIRNKIMLQQTNQIAAMTESQAQTYMNDYESSTSYYTLKRSCAISASNCAGGFLN